MLLTDFAKELALAGLRRLFRSTMLTLVNCLKPARNSRSAALAKHNPGKESDAAHFQPKPVEVSDDQSLPSTFFNHNYWWLYRRRFPYQKAMKGPDVLNAIRVKGVRCIWKRIRRGAGL